MQQGYGYGMPMPSHHFQQHQQHQHQHDHGHSAQRSINGFDGRSRSQSDAAVSKMSALLDQADNSELKELHDSEEKIHKFLDENDQVQQLQAEREMQVAGNQSLAEYNLNQGPKLVAGKQRLGELYKKLHEQTKQFEENKRNLESLAGQYNPDTIMALLQTSVAQSEESSEKIADNFLDGDLSVDDFLDKYLKERTDLHLRRTKVDKLKELMRGRR